MANLRGRVHDIIEDALQKAGVSFDTDGENIWVDDEDGNTVSLNVIDCESADADEDDAEPQQQDELEPKADDNADGNHRFTVSINATLGTVVEVTAPDEETAEGIVNVKWMNDEIKLDELTLHDTRIDCTGRLD